MLITPHIVRSHELTAEDVGSIYIGTQAEHRPERAAAADRADSRGRPRATPPAPPGRAGRRAPTHAAGRRARAAGGESAGGAQPTNPPVPPGTLADTRVSRHGGTGRRPADAGAPPPATPPVSRRSPRCAAGRHRRRAIRLAPAAPATRRARRPRRDGDADHRDAAAVSSGRRRALHRADLDQQRVADVGDHVTVSYNPAILRVRTVQDGTFMRQGGVTASFTPRIDAANGRVDIAIARTGDQTGASRRRPARRAAVRRAVARARRRSP